jgi:DNA-directed RNA polymerase subunit H (RpoH/RPB5)
LNIAERILTLTMQSHFLPRRVYDNLYELIKHRHLELVSGDVTGLVKNSEPEEFVSALQYYGYIILEAKDAAHKDRRYPKRMHRHTRSLPVKTLFILLDINSTYVTAASEMVKLMNLVPGIKETQREYNMDIILIPYDIPGSNITNKLAEYSFIGDENNGYIRIDVYKYALFTSNKMTHISACPSRIISRKEEEELLAQTHSNKVDLHRMRSSEAVAIWLGAEVGDIVLQEPPSEASGVETIYFLVRL